MVSQSRFLLKMKNLDDLAERDLMVYQEMSEQMAYKIMSLEQILQDYETNPWIMSQIHNTYYPMIMSKNWELIIAMNEIAMILSIDQILNHFKESFLITPYEIADQMIEQNNNLWSKYPYQQELLEAKMEYLDRAYGTWIFHRWTSALISKNQENFILSLKPHEMKTFLAAAQMQEKVELMSSLTMEAQTLLKTGESLLEVLKKTKTDQFYCLWTKMLKIHKTMNGKNMILARREILLSY